MLKKSFIEAQIANGGREDIVKYIADVRFFENRAGSEAIRRMFRNKFKRGFASMLKDEFGDGEVVQLPEINHWVFKCEGVCYDIEGVFEVE